MNASKAILRFGSKEIKIFRTIFPLGWIVTRTSRLSLLFDVPHRNLLQVALSVLFATTWKPPLSLPPPKIHSNRKKKNTIEMTR